MSTNTAPFTPSVGAATPAVRPTAAATPGLSRRIVFLIAGALAVLALGGYGWKHLQFALAHEDTDDAQVEGDISPVLPRVSGYVTRVLVQDNQHVSAGQPLLEVDARELDLRQANAADALATARASQLTAQANVKKAQAALAVAQSQVTVAAVRDAKAASDLKRDTSLFQTSAITDRQLSDTQAAADVASAEHGAAIRQAAAAQTDVAVAQAEAVAAAAAVQSRQSELEYAQLQRSYAVVTAPIAGIVSRKNVEPGQFVQAGQTLLSIASDTGVWVVANYKETQMAKIRTGQPVEIAVDSYPGVTFEGRVESIAGATGARFALLPPDNSSGNFIKVTQRVPVKILLVGAAADRPLRAGMSVDAAVQTKS